MPAVMEAGQTAESRCLRHLDSPRALDLSPAAANLPLSSLRSSWTKRIIHKQDILLLLKSIDLDSYLLSLLRQESVLRI
jgi:hypothetical protein